MTRKIAPRLTEIVDDLDGHPDFLKSDHPTCLRELRALKHVARVMERQIAAIDRRYPELADGRDVAECRRALARLSLPGSRR